MKLRKKETGEIGYFCFANWNDPVLIIMDKDGVQLAKYNSLAEMNAEWEDAPEEPKTFWAISWAGEPEEYDAKKTPQELKDMAKAIGNYFETKEEAEKAVEKFKAWKRLKDKGFRFIDHIDRDSGQGMTRYEWDGYINGEDLDLLFGGEK